MSYMVILALPIIIFKVTGLIFKMRRVDFDHKKARLWKWLLFMLYASARKVIFKDRQNGANIYITVILL